MPSHRLSARARRLAPTLTGALLLASCSSLLGIEDPVPRDCTGGRCEDDGGTGGVPAGSSGKSAIVAGSENKPNDGGVGGAPTTPKVDAGEGGAIHSTSVGGMGGETGGAPPQIECDDTETRCNIYQRQICISGHWMDDGDECPLACVDGECQTPASCAPAATPLPCIGGVDCCETVWMEGGAYLMGTGDEEDEVSYSREVSGFYLDRFEVTVARFEHFKSEYRLPSEGDAAHPKLPGSGWRKAWEDVAHNFADGRKAVPVDADDLVRQLTEDCGDAGTWGNQDRTLPISCANWYVAFAFCAFDGGRLPTEAEWNYAAAAGSQQRPYPWSSSSSDTAIESTHAVYYAFPTPPPDLPSPVGAHESGRGAFYRFEGRGHDDLAGNVGEWTLDQWLAEPPAVCSEDCFAAWDEGVEERVVRGGAYGSPYNELRSGSRTWAAASEQASYWGFRCARDVETSSAE